MKVFISQAMAGQTEEAISERRKKALEHIQSLYPKRHIEVIDNWLNDKDMSNPAECLGESIKLMSHADLAVFLGDYYNYRGCMIERLVCSRYGIRWMELREL